jgi:hypothetical protein
VGRLKERSFESFLACSVFGKKKIEEVKEGAFVPKREFLGLFESSPELPFFAADLLLVGFEPQKLIRWGLKDPADGLEEM